MISESVVSQQVIRLSALGAPPDCVDELKHAYREAAKNGSHASRITDWILRHLVYFPKPAEIYQAATLTIQPGDMPRSDSKCLKCAGTGWEPVWQLVTHKRMGESNYKSIDVIDDEARANVLKQAVDGKDQIVYDCRRRCTHCSYGAALATAEAQKNTEDNARKETAS